MDQARDTFTPDRRTQARQVQVWDLPTRLFHWLLVAFVAAGVATGYVAPEWWMGTHVWAGYGIVVLVVFRLAWGVFGSEYSRITTFAYSPGEVARHLRGLVMLRPSHYIGHNPTGAVMIFALIFVLVAISVTGLLALGGEENQGPLAGVAGFQIGAAAKVAHGYLVNALLVMVAGHVLGVIVESILCRDNLVHAMIKGNKHLPEDVPHPRPRKAHPVAAALTIGAFVLPAGVILGGLSRLPPTGLLSLPVSAKYRSECGDCHQVYHPSLLPAASWKGLMAHLDDHFGEDASLDEKTAKAIESYLARYASEAWGTEAANRFRIVSTKDPWRISATPYWVKKHGNVPESVFARKDVGSKGNCAACHHDAASGRFDDQMITIGKEKSS